MEDGEVKSNAMKQLNPQTEELTLHLQKLQWGLILKNEKWRLFHLMALTDTLWSNWMGCSPWLSGPWKRKSSRRPNYESPTLASDEPFRVLIHPLTGFDWAVLRLSVIDHWKDRLRDNQRRSGVARRGNRCLTGDRVATSRQTLSPQTPSRLVHGHKINVPDADAAALQMINRALSHARSKKSGLTRFSLFKGSTFHRERNQRISRFRLSYKTYIFFFLCSDDFYSHMMLLLEHYMWSQPTEGRGCRKLESIGLACHVYYFVWEVLHPHSLSNFHETFRLY